MKQPTGTHQNGLRHNASIEIGNSPKRSVEAYKVTMSRSLRGIGGVVKIYSVLLVHAI